MASLTDSLEQELGPLPTATKAPTHRKPFKTGGDLFSRANSVDTVALLDWLGIQHETTSRGVMAICPGCGEDGALVCKDGGLKCLHQRCADAGPTDKPGFRTNLDVAIKARGGTLDAVSVAQEIVQRFGLEREFKKREIPDFNELDPADAWVEETPAPGPDPREPGDDTEEIASEPVAPVVQLNQSKVPAVQRFGILSMQGLLKLVVDELAKEKPRRGLPTGSAILDAAIGGLRSGNITVLGAKRSFGKTSFSIHVADTCLNANAKVLMLAGEDAAIMYGKRWLARRSGLNAMRLRDLEATREELGIAAKACAAASNIPFFLNVSGQPIEWIVSAVRQIAKEQQIDLVIVDYLQCLRLGQRSQDRRNEVTTVTKLCVEVIREVGAAGLLLSQLKRSDRIRPEIEDLKESGDIEDMADHVLLGFKESESEDESVKRFLVLAKNKDGVDELDDIELDFDKRTANFRVQTDGRVPPGGEEYDPRDDYQDYSERRFP